MKRFLWILCFVLLISCGMACNKMNESADGSLVGGETTSVSDGFTYYTDVRFAQRVEVVSLCEAGILYDDQNTGGVRLVTIDEGDDIPFCYDPNCSHNSAEQTGGDPRCIGALYPSFCKTSYYNGTLYFWDGDGVFDHNIYAVNTNGSGRKLLAKLPFFYHIGYLCIFNEDKVYYLAKIPYEDEFLNKGGYRERVVEVSLKDGSYRFITEESTGWINQAGMAGDTIYMRKAREGDGQLYVEAVNVKTQEVRTVITPEEWKAGTRYFEACDDDSYYYWDKNTHEIGIRNIDGTVEKVLVAGGASGWLSPSTNGMLYERDVDYEGEPAGFYFMDFETGEVINITEEAEKYNLIFYKGYYNAFIGREYIEKEGYFAWGMWSKDKIISEAKARQQIEGNEG